jgi:peptidoglycan hydrolase-like protein with peptidoglycan-binding domain
VGAASFVLALAVSAPASAHSRRLGERVLKPGMRGQDVSALQHLLARAGFQIRVSGVFDAATTREVQAFERRHHLRADGVAGPTVIHELKASAAPRSGSSGSGSSGSGSAVARTASTNAASGGAGAGTTTSTSSRTATTSGGHKYPGDSIHLGDRILRQRMSGHDVRVLQDFLTRAGFPASVDGQFGPGTKRAVVAFQRAHHLRANGVVDWNVAQALRAAVASTGATTLQTTQTAPAGRATISNGLAVAPSNAPASVKAVIAAANRIAFKPYVYGGGHASWNSSGYDCSGSVSYALHGGGLLSSPEDSTGLESYGSPGAGRWISIWANAGHTYMYVAGLRFDTSAQGSTGGSRWTSQGRSNSGYVERHPTGL